MSRRRWTELELDVLRMEFADSPTADLATLFGRSYVAVAYQAWKLGLKKSAAFLASPASSRLDGRTGWTHRFMPGHRPWNTGKKVGTRGRSAQTQFKPGVLSGRAAQLVMPVGSLRVNAAGYLEQKTSTRSGPPRMRWTAVHRLVWESAHGPIEPGHVVVFRPGRRSANLDEITLDALELVTRAELMGRNSVHNLPPELAQIAQLRGVLNRKINQRATP